MPVPNRALWLPKRGGTFEVGSAPYTRPDTHEIVVRTHAVAVNPFDGLPGFAYRLVLPWLTFPAVIGSDVAGEVVEVGSSVSRFKPGDRVVGHASRKRAAEGAFQLYSILADHMASPLPDHVPFEQGAVLPLALSTASSGLFQQDQLGLALPTHAHAADEQVVDEQVVLVWGGSTSVGSNAIQLACNAGYRVITTASPRNHEFVRSLGAEAAVDYRSPGAVDQIVELIGGSSLAGTLAIGSGSLAPSTAIASRTTGSRRVSSAQRGPATSMRTALARRRGVTVTAVFGGSLRDNEVGPGIYADFLPDALASGAYRPAPQALVVGNGLEAIPAAIEQVKKGVSARKLVVTL
ncbi:zinc-binding alcohol dehydrogenase family protein [Streptomyces sp. NPDC048179]|uniref:zinc-binding alcohol dehydrogenase family protein n=1 Tax=Streptomyces sp. NPDC048179 TaxID=3365506 RepID=UPI0037167FCC